MAGVGDNLKALREARGWRQEDLAAVAHLKQGDISKWEKGTVPRVSTLIRLAVALGVDLDQLVTGFDPEYDAILAKLVVPAEEQSLLPVAPATVDVDGQTEMDPSHPSARLTRYAADILAVGQIIRSWRPPSVARRRGSGLPARDRPDHARPHSEPPEETPKDRHR